MIVHKQKPIFLKNTCGAVYDEELVKKAILWYTTRPVSRVKTVFMYGRYPAVSIYGEKIHLHRLLFMYDKGVDLDFLQFVHHKDGDRLNATLDNLELIGASRHGSLHNKGKKLSPEHRAKISEANRKRKGIKMKRRVNIPRLELLHLIDQGYTINGIAKHFGCDWSTIKSRVDEL
ncbi:hypothetical protein LCGC14_0428270 [marine sediment metagenome]|uniref:HNH nuclease domain-containing protein n=1 Tax=marine sediment metagenome TaxID=412755 RepID=A0A0F9T6U8_9ZZZZ